MKFVKGMILGSMLLSSTAFAAAKSPAPLSSTGTWNVSGDVQGVAVVETCVLTEADKKITGDCEGATGKYPASGSVQADGSITFTHGGKYEGSDISVTYSGKLSEDGGALSGSIDVQPFGVSGSFTATKGKPATS